MLDALLDGMLEPETPVPVPLLEDVPSMMVPNVGLGLVTVVPDDVVVVVAIGSPVAGSIAGPVGVKGLAGVLGVSPEGLVCATAGDAAANTANVIDTRSLFMQVSFCSQQPPAPCATPKPASGSSLGSIGDASSEFIAYGGAHMPQRAVEQPYCKDRRGYRQERKV
jgi:hypothetical protein